MILIAICMFKGIFKTSSTIRFITINLKFKDSKSNGTKNTWTDQLGIVIRFFFGLVAYINLERTD